METFTHPKLMAGALAIALLIPSATAKKENLVSKPDNNTISNYQILLRTQAREPW